MDAALNSLKAFWSTLSAELDLNLGLMSLAVLSIGTLVGFFISKNLKPAVNDSKQQRIDALEADFKISKEETDVVKAELERREEIMLRVTEDVEKRKDVILGQITKANELKASLEASKKKTLELRSELFEREAENQEAEFKLKEVETELSMSQASADLIAAGMLEYSEEED